MTAATLYCAVTDLYRYGYRPGALANPARTIAEVSAATELLSLDDHGFADGDALVFRVEDGGEMPAPLVAGTTYYARDTSGGSTFSVAATDGGVAINITDAGSNVLVSTSIVPTIEAVIEKYSRLWDSYCIADSVPYEEGAVPTLAKASVAEAAAAAMLEIQGQASEIQQRKLERVEKEFARLARGAPLRDSVGTPPANLAAFWSETSRGWDGGTPGSLP